MRKDQLDVFGGSVLLGVSLLLALNQIGVKIVNAGLQPVFYAGLRSVLAVFFVWGWLAYKGRPPRIKAESVGPGLLIGVCFAAEFLLIFLAIDLTTVGRASVIMYSMPVWYVFLAHFGLGEKTTPLKALGLALAFAGCAWALLSRPSTGEASLVGDLCALGAAWGWALTAFVARRPVMRAEGPEMQLFWMVLVSGPILLLASLFFGPLIRDLQNIHLVLLLLQSSVVAAGGFITWLWLMSVYPSSTVASFSFLTPVLALFLGATFFGETLNGAILGAVVLVAIGIILINRPSGPKA
ncbi:RhaT Permeases of the drug/metabolite transporter (DMT) superfamily [Paracoccaceae bacterium]